MNSTDKYFLANFSSLTGLGLTIADVQSMVSVLVLITALLLNVSRLIDWVRKRRKTQD